MEDGYAVNERPRWCRELNITNLCEPMEHDTLNERPRRCREVDIINFCESIEDGDAYMRGHAGVGKSTLLKLVWVY